MDLPEVLEPLAPDSPVVTVEQEFCKRWEDLPKVFEQSWLQEDLSKEVKLAQAQEDLPEVAESVQAQKDVVEGAERAQVQEDLPQVVEPIQAQRIEQPLQLPNLSAPDATVAAIIIESETEEEDDLGPPLEGARVKKNKRLDTNTAKENEVAIESGRVRTVLQHPMSNAIARTQQKEALVEVLNSRASNAVKRFRVHTGQDMQLHSQEKELASRGTGHTALEDLTKTRKPLVYTRKDNKKRGSNQGVDIWLYKERDTQLPAPVKKHGDGDTSRTLEWYPLRSQKSFTVVQKVVPIHEPTGSHDVGVAGVEVSEDLSILDVPLDQEIGALGTLETDEERNRVKAASGDPPMKPVREGLLTGNIVDNQQESLVDVTTLNCTRTMLKMDITSVATTSVDNVVVAAQEGEGGKSKVLDGLSHEDDELIKVSIVDTFKDLCALLNYNE